jgi:hypothetical protein
MRLGKRDRWFAGLALALTVAAVAAPPVQATGYAGGPEFPTWTVSPRRCIARWYWVLGSATGPPSGCNTPVAA